MRKPFKYVSQYSTIVRTTSSRLQHVFTVFNMTVLCTDLENLRCAH